MSALRKYIKNPKIRQIIVLFQQHWGRMEIGRQSAEMAYYVLLALLPTLLLLGNIIPLLPLPREQVLSYVEMALPHEVSNTITPILKEYLNSGSGGVVSFGLVLSIWTASKAFNVFQNVLNQVYNTKMRKNFIVHRIFSFVIAFLLVAMISLVAVLFMFGRYIRDFFEEFLSIRLDFITAFENVRWIGAFLIISVIMTVIYFVVPNVRWSFKFSVPGAAFATIGFLLISQLFSLYVGVAGSQAIGNSAIGVVITLLLWLYLMGAVLILGGFLNVMLYHYFRPLPIVLKEESRYAIRYSKNALALTVNEQSLKRRLIRKQLRIQANKQADTSLNPERRGKEV